MSVTNLIGRRSGPQLECMPTLDAERLAETLVAFANSDGGHILLGVTPAGHVIGNLQEEEVEGALRHALINCRPPVRTEWQLVPTVQGNVVSIFVPRSTELHSLGDGRVVVRNGADNGPLGGEQIRQLAATKSSSDFEAEPMAGATLADLDDAIISEYIEKREERQRRKLTLSRAELLTQIGALTPDLIPTTVGILLFGREPQVFLPHSGAVFVRFTGTEARGPQGLPGYGRREEINGPLARLIERLWQVIWSEMRVQAVVRGLQREEKPEYPPFAVREALVNAVCHRDYRLRGRRIEARMFDDRLEMSSPGGLPGYITLDNIVEENFSRNPRLVNGLFQWGYIEELGLGIDRMIEDMVKNGHPQPEFKPTPYAFSVVLRNIQTSRPIPAWQQNMNERQLRAIQFIQTSGRITNRDYRDLCPDVSAETLRLDFADMVDKGVLLKVGDKKGTYYVLK